MMTFLVSNDFNQCSRILDPERLNRQIQDCCRIASCLKAYELVIKLNGGRIPFGMFFPKVIQLWLSNSSSFMYTHPNGYKECKKIGSGEILLPELHYYFLCMCFEWERIRGKEHQLFLTFDWTGKESRGFLYKLNWPEEVFLFHRSKLLEKDFSYYSRKLNQEKLKNEGTGFRSTWERPSCI